MIEFKEVEKRYPNGYEALRHINLTIDQGEFVAIIGLSGAGKSTLIRTINRMHDITQGTLTVDGTDVMSLHGKSLRKFRRKIGMIFQSFNLITRTTVIKNVLTAFVPALPWWRATLGIFTKAEKMKALEALDQMGILDKAFVRADQLSGGQQQRVALARILASQPEVLLLDEPFSALDSYLKWQVELELADILSAFPGPVLFVTHNRDEVQRLCQQVCVLDSGRSQAVMPVHELFEAPRTLSACLLSGCKNVSRARPAADGMVEALDWGVTLYPGQPLPEGLTHIGVRAHYIRPAEGPGPNTLPCRVERVVENVFSTVVMLSTPGGSQGFSRLRIELEKERWAALAHQDPLWLELPAKDLLLLTGG